MFRFSPRAEISYSMEFRGDSLHLGVVFVARAEDQLYGVSKLPPKPVLPDTSRFLSGGTSGRWWLQYNERTHTAWVETQKVTLGNDNVVLLHGIESLHHPPRIVGTMRIPATIYSGGCRNGENWSDLLEAHLRKVPEIRAFASK